MRLSLRRFPLRKAVPLAISRGTTSAVEHLLVEISHGGTSGCGETGGFDTGHRHYDTGAVAAELERLAPQLEGLEPQPLQALEPLLAIWPCTTGGASGWGYRCTGSGAWIREPVSPPA
jgi:hypothetical protein